MSDLDAALDAHDEQHGEAIEAQATSADEQAEWARRVAVWIIATALPVLERLERQLQDRGHSVHVWCEFADNTVLTNKIGLAFKAAGHEHECTVTFQTTTTPDLIDVGEYQDGKFVGAIGTKIKKLNAAAIEDRVTSAVVTALQVEPTP